MSPERIKKHLDETPFQPFTIHTGDGSEVDVLSKEFTLLYPGGRTLLVVVPKLDRMKSEADFEEHHIDVFLITKVTSPPKRGNGNGHSRRSRRR